MFYRHFFTLANAIPILVKPVMRRKYYFSIVFLLFSLTAFSTSTKSLSVIDFGAIPNDTINDRDAIPQALDYCRIHKVKELVIPSGKYIIRDINAIQRNYSF